MVYILKNPGFSRSIFNVPKDKYFHSMMIMLLDSQTDVQR
jgi:hypothetical protein